MPTKNDPATLLKEYKDQPDTDTRKIQARLPLGILKPLWEWGVGQDISSETEVLSAFLTTSLLTDAAGAGCDSDYLHRVISHICERCGWILVRNREELLGELKKPDLLAEVITMIRARAKQQQQEGQ